MALVSTPGLLFPGPVPNFDLSPGVSISTNSNLDATGEKFAWIGRVWNKDGSTKDITKVGFRFGAAVIKAGGSGMTVSLQNVDTANGPVHRPDGIQDQTVAIANGDAGFVATAFYMTNAFSANRTVAYGELLAVVLEYDGSGRLGADNVTTAHVGSAVNDGLDYLGGQVHFAASWVAQVGVPILVLEFSDGSFGTLMGHYPIKEATSVTYQMDTTGADEHALEFQVPFDCTFDGFVAVLSMGTGASLDAILLDGSDNVLSSVSVLEKTSVGTANERQALLPMPRVDLTKNTTYRLSMKPTTAAVITIATVEVSAAAHFQGWPGGEAFRLATRVDGGAWTTVTTKRPLISLMLGRVDVSAGGGGGSGYPASRIQSGM